MYVLQSERAYCCTKRLRLTQFLILSNSDFSFSPRPFHIENSKKTNKQTMEQKIFKKSALVFLHSLRPNKKTIKFASLHTDEYIVLAICHKMFVKYPNLQSVKIASTSARMCLYSHYTHYIYLSMFVAVKRLFIFYCYYYSLLRFVQPEGCGK